MIQSQTDIAIFLLFFLNTFLIALPENKQLCDLLLSWTLQLKTYLHSVSEGGVFQMEEENTDECLDQVGTQN